ncbi:PTS transporter subunit EIIC [Kitasatospora sp. RB6PN24]|uniref:PTS transporter subunit EIIC n=1 Tax=Kitasatospora humi TaxID=2893891 RepID=UPI001E491DEE|nr:PTS transporter subunit EIIC [Kitasatospora humi]MCC9308570.1 PTS transporter subunit EIIC [Kitasatospora humi]
MSTTAQAASPAAPSPARKSGQNLLQGLQKMGRSLQLPIAVLPAAGLLLRLGQDDVFGKDGLGWNKVAAVFDAAGGSILDTKFGLPLLFAIGIAIGFAKKADGSTALAAVVGFLVYSKVLTAFPVTEGHLADGTWVEATYQNPGVLGGIVIGLLSAVLWQRFHRTKLVDWLGFFNGRRLVPILMAFVGTAVGVLFAQFWGPVGDAIGHLNNTLIGAGALGAGAFGLVNRALLPVGMHQFVNSYAWFQAGDFTKPDGTVVHGDLTRYLFGDPTAGQFMAGFFPIMMFALPAAALAIAHCARPERRKAVLGMMMSLALTSFVTGVTEPIEFAFVFIAPALYVVHVLLTAVSMAVTWALGVHLGFTFSAGLIDLLLGWSHGRNQWLVLPIGLVFAAVYYFVFRFVITRFDLPTPGREPEEEIEDTTKA